MTESKFETMVGGEMVHFGGEVTSYPAHCLDQNVDMYHYHLALKNSLRHSGKWRKNKRC